MMREFPTTDSSMSFRLVSVCRKFVMAARIALGLSVLTRVLVRSGTAFEAAYSAFSSVQLLDRGSTGPFVVAAGLQDPGNLGTILRSAEAFGAAGVFLTEGTVSPYNSKVLRGSAGSIFRLPVVRITSGELLPLLRARGVRLLATSSHQGTPLPQISWTLPLAIFIGNEGAGLSRELARQMDETLAIPQAPQVESLNAGVAASIVLYEAARNRGDRDKDNSHHRRTET